MIGLCTILAIVHPAGAASGGAGGRTAALLTYHYDGWTLLPSKCFSGVVISDRHIVTSARALRQGHSGPFGGGGGGDRPGEIYAVLRSGKEQVVLRCRPFSAGRGSPLAILEILETDRSLVREALDGPPEFAALDTGTSARLIAAVSPFGLQPEEFSTETVPAPVETTLALGAASSRADGRFAAAAVEHPLPPQAAGAGVWDEADRLVGIVLRDDRSWRVLDAASARDGMTSPAPGPIEPAENPLPADLSDPVQSNRPPSQTSASLKGLYDILDASGLTMQIDPGLADYVGRGPADRVMMLIAGGRVPDALELLDELEPSADEELAEQLTYRRALALTIEGRYDEARAEAMETLDADDELVRARGRTLFHVLEEHSDGGFRARPLREPVVLVEAIHDHLGRIAEQLRLAFFAAQSEDRAGRDGFREVDRRLDLIARQIEAQEHAWPGYFDGLAQRVGVFHERVVRGEYLRAYGELRSAYRGYQLERRRVEHKAEGTEWAEAGYFPPERVENANALAERCHDLMGYVERIGRRLDAADRMELPDDLAAEVERLPPAKPMDS